MNISSTILSQSDWWMLNKAVTRKIGIDASILLSDLISKQEYFETREMLDSNGFFFNVRESVLDDTTLPQYRQVKAIEVLKNLGLIETNKRGIPPKIRFKINPEEINRFVFKVSAEDREVRKNIKVGSTANKSPNI